MIAQLLEAVSFKAFYTASGVGKTGLTVTIDVYSPAGTKIISNGSATEVGGGLYSYGISVGTLTQTGEYVGIFKTTDTTVSQQHMAAVWVCNRAGVGYLDASVNSRNATTPPTADAIADAVADNALAGHTTPGTVGAALSTASAAGDPWAKTGEELAAYADGTAAKLFSKLDVGTPDSPVVVVPAPPADASMCTVYCYTESLVGTKRAGIVASFRLSGKPGKSDRVLETAEVQAATDADGMLSINLQRTDTLTPSGLHYLVSCRELGLSNVQMTLEAETFDLGGLIS